MQNFYIEKSCNAFQAEAKTSWGWGFGSRLSKKLQKTIAGGLWIHGKFIANGEWLMFEPGNFLNDLINQEGHPVQIHISTVLAINLESGYFNDTVIIRHSNGEFKFYCDEAKEVANSLASYHQYYQQYYQNNRGYAGR